MKIKLLVGFDITCLTSRCDARLLGMKADCVFHYVPRVPSIHPSVFSSKKMLLAILYTTCLRRYAKTQCWKRCCMQHDMSIDINRMESALFCSLPAAKVTCYQKQQQLRGRRKRAKGHLEKETLH
jgi:hypothetical protein